MNSVLHALHGCDVGLLLLCVNDTSAWKETVSAFHQNKSLNGQNIFMSPHEIEINDDSIMTDGITLLILLF